MKRFLLYTAAIALSISATNAANRALYVKQADGIHRYSFGVAGNLKFDFPQNKMMITGYDAAIMLDQVEYMTFDLPTDGQLTPNAHKDKLIQVGQELNSKIDANKSEALAGLFAEYDNLPHLDDEAIFEDFRKAHPNLFDDDYYRVAIKNLVKAVDSFGKGNFGAARTVGKTYTELFTSADLTGVFTADVDRREWVKTANADYFEINFVGPVKGKHYTLRFDTSKEYTEWTDAAIIKEDDGSISTYNLTGRAPSRIDGVVKVNGRDAFSSTLYITLDSNKKAINVRTVSQAEDVCVEDNIAINNNSAKADLVVKINAEKIFANTTDLTGSMLLDVAEWCNDIQANLDEYELNHYGEYYYEADGRKICRKFGTVSSYADVLGKLQVRAHVANYDSSYDDIETYAENNDESDSTIINHNKRTITHVYGSEKWMGKIADLLNNYTDAAIYYDGSDVLQGFITWNVYEDIDDCDYYTKYYWDDEKEEYVELDTEYKVIDIDYIITPYLTFSDGTTFAFDSDFFTGGNFNVLVNDAEDIAKIIENILDSYDD